MKNKLILVIAALFLFSSLKSWCDSNTDKLIHAMIFGALYDATGVGAAELPSNLIENNIVSEAALIEAGFVNKEGKADPYHPAIVSMWNNLLDIKAKNGLKKFEKHFSKIKNTKELNEFKRNKSIFSNCSTYGWQEYELKIALILRDQHKSNVNFHVKNKFFNTQKVF